MDATKNRRSYGLAVLLPLVPIVALSTACEECEIGDQWCDGNAVKLCVLETSDSMFGGSDVVVRTDETCAEYQQCMEWPIHPDSRAAGCVARDACVTERSFCQDGETIATCSVQGEDPSFNYCGDDNFEGFHCVQTTAGAVCTFSNDPCDLAGALRCCGATRYYLQCGYGYWTVLDSCLLGESCVQLSDTEIDCQIGVRP